MALSTVLAAAGSIPTCLPSASVGEWIFSLDHDPSSLPSRPCIGSLQKPELQVVRLERSGLAYAWDEHARFSGTLSEGTHSGHFTTLGTVDAVEIATPDLVFFAFGCGDGVSKLSGSWHDANAERKGCFTAVRNASVDCATTNECHSAQAAPLSAAGAGQLPGPASSSPRSMVTRRLRLGLRHAPSRRTGAEAASALVPPQENTQERTPTDEEHRPLRSDAASAAAINASTSLHWRSTSEPTGPLVRQLRRLLGQSELVAAEVPSDAEVAAMAAAVAGSGDWDPGANGSLSDLALPSHSPWPTALDWRTYRGGGWLSAPVDILSTLPRPCVGATHVVSALASVEAHPNRSAPVRASVHTEALACTPS